MINERSSTDRWPQRLPLTLIGVNYEYCNHLDYLRLRSVGTVYSSLQTTGPYSTVMGLMTMSPALLIVRGYVLIACVLVRDINKARKVYKFNYVRLGSWTVRQPNGRFTRTLANVLDIATLGSKL